MYCLAGVQVEIQTVSTILLWVCRTTLLWTRLIQHSHLEADGSLVLSRILAVCSFLSEVPYLANQAHERTDTVRIENAIIIVLSFP